MGQEFPGTAAAHGLEDAVENLTAALFYRTATWFGSQHEWFSSFPFRIAEIGIVSGSRRSQSARVNNCPFSHSLLNAQAEVAEAKALQNLRWQYEQDKAELTELRKERFEQEEQEEEEERQQAEAAQQRRQEQARQRAERKRALEGAAANPDGFEFSTVLESDKPTLTLWNREK